MVLFARISKLSNSSSAQKRAVNVVKRLKRMNEIYFLHESAIANQRLGTDGLQAVARNE